MPCQVLGPLENRYKCSICWKKCAHASDLKRHMKTCQKKAMTHELKQLKEENDKLKAQIQSLPFLHNSDNNKTQKDATKHTNNTTNNTTNNSTTNNNTTNNTTNNNTINNTNNVTIVLNCFGKESLEHITPQYLKQLIGGPFTSTSEIIKRIHFDVDHPENSNVKIPNKKLPWAEVYSDDKWMMKKKKEVLEGMVDKGFNIIDEAYHSIDPSEISTFQKDRYNVYQKTYKNKQTFRKQLVQDAELVVLNQ